MWVLMLWMYEFYIGKLLFFYVCLYILFRVVFVFKLLVYVESLLCFYVIDFCCLLQDFLIKKGYCLVGDVCYKEVS